MTLRADRAGHSATNQPIDDLCDPIDGFVESTDDLCHRFARFGEPIDDTGRFTVPSRHRA